MSWLIEPAYSQIMGYARVIFRLDSPWNAVLRPAGRYPTKWRTRKPESAFSIDRLVS